MVFGGCAAARTRSTVHGNAGNATVVALVVLVFIANNNGGGGGTRVDSGGVGVRTAPGAASREKPTTTVFAPHRGSHWQLRNVHIALVCTHGVCRETTRDLFNPLNLSSHRDYARGIDAFEQ